MHSEGSVTGWIGELRRGNQQAAEELWRRYFQQLVRLGRRKLSSDHRRAADEEDLALSALDSFFRGVGCDRYPHLRDRHDLWQLLVMIAARKAIDQFRHEHRQKRSTARTVEPFGREGDGLEQIIGREPTPEFAIQVAEQCQRLLDRLGDKASVAIAQLKLECHSNEEIARQLDCSLRTVERKLELIRAKWSQKDSTDE